VSRRDDCPGALRHDARAFLDFAEYPGDRVDGERQRRRFRPWVVRQTPRTGAVPRDTACMVGRESPSPMPAFAIAPVLCSRSGRYRDPYYPAELSSVRMRAMAVHAQWLDRWMEPPTPPSGGVDSRRTLPCAYRDD